MAVKQDRDMRASTACVCEVRNHLSESMGPWQAAGDHYTSCATNSNQAADMLVLKSHVQAFGAWDCAETWHTQESYRTVYHQCP